jgi:hypothetical protein
MRRRSGRASSGRGFLASPPGAARYRYGLELRSGAEALTMVKSFRENTREGVEAEQDTAESPCSAFL